MEATPAACDEFGHLKRRLNGTEIKTIRHVMSKPALRELYDKTETFIRPTYETSKYNPSQATRYLQACQDLLHFGMFILFMSFSVEKYQNFAKQVTISSLLIAATVCVYLKLPKEGNQENDLILWVDTVRWLDDFTYFELNFVLKTIVYPAIFSMAMNVSRLVDIDPQNVVRINLQECQKKVSKSLVLGELITNLDSTKVEELPQI